MCDVSSMPKTEESSPTEKPAESSLEAFDRYWADHQVHKQFDDEAVLKTFRDFAYGVWNSAQFDISMRYADLLMSAPENVEGETRHETARRLITESATCKEEAADAHEALEFYKGLLDQCGEAIGPDAYIADDDSVSDSVLRAKLPELVKRLVSDLKEAI